MPEKNGNWTINDTKQIYANDFFQVFEDDVIKPDGQNGKYSTIRVKNGVSVLPVDEEGFVYLTKQFRYAIERMNLEVISGAVGDETQLKAAQREAKEELGIEAEEWIDLGFMESDTSLIKSTSYLYLARKLTFGKSHPEGSEEIEMVKMKFDKAVEKVMVGEITHAQTCVLILKARQLS